jgi:hypothetical protein
LSHEPGGVRDTLELVLARCPEDQRGELRAALMDWAPPATFAAPYDLR